MLVGIYVGFVPAGYEAVMLCLRNAILPKDKLLARMPQIKGEWPCQGVPRTILLDNGMEFHSEHLKDACTALGINIVYHPARQPHYKGAVERLFGSINTGFLNELKGKTFSNIREKGDYNSVKEAVVPFDVFETALYKWITDVYSRRFHTGIQDYPLEVWEKGVAEVPADMPASAEDLLVLLCEVKYPTLTNKGFQADTVQYNSEELNAYFRRLGKKSTVKVKVDPLDVGRVYVFDKEASRFITVPAVDSSYSGLSKWQVKIANRLVRARKKQGDAKYGIADACREITDYIAEETAKGKKRPHKKMARHAEYTKNAKTQVPLPSNSPPQFIPDFDPDGVDVSSLLDNAVKDGWINLNAQEGM